MWGMTGEQLSLVGALAVAVAFLAGAVKVLFAKYERQTEKRIEEAKERGHDDETDE